MATQRLEATERHRRQLTAQAVELAMKSQWEQAVQVNREIIALFPSDMEAYNRLGKAYMELGRIAEAKEAYRKALELDPSNVIAQKNLERLSQVENTEVVRPVGGAQLSPDFFIEETGKTGQTNLIHLAPPEVLAKVTPGDAVELIVMGRSLMAATPSGVPLGEVPPPLALRLITLIEGGNRYSAVISSISENNVSLLIKETYQHPSQAGKFSFPPKAMPEAFRSYIRPTGILDYGSASAEPEELEDRWEEHAEEVESVEGEEEEERPRLLRREQLMEEESLDEMEEEEE